MKRSKLVPATANLTTSDTKKFDKPHAGMLEYEGHLET